MNTNVLAYSNKKYFDNLEPDKVAVALVSLAVSVVVCILLLTTNGNILAAAGLVTAISILLILFYRVDWGFFVFFFMVLLFDQHNIPGFDPITFRAGYFLNLKENIHLPAISSGVINPVELQLVLMLLAWFIAISIRKRTKIQHIQEWGLAVVFLISLVLSFLNGMNSGGKFLPALWELRALFYFGFLFFLIPQVINTKKQCETLMWVFIAGVTIKALQGIWRFTGLGFSCAGYETLTNHEDPVFIAILIVFLISITMLKANEKQRNALLVLLPFLLIGFFTGQRRAAYAGLFISLVAFVIILQSKDRVMFFRTLMVLLLIGIIYSAVFWESESKFASPLRLIQSSINPDTGNERYLSNLYREFERYNLAYTIKTNDPITGIGFGNKYQNIIPLPNIIFPLRDYIPHNEILWLFVKSGAIGFFIFFLFFNALIFRCTSLYPKLKDPYLKTICLIIVIAIINQLVVSYFDLQLTYYRNMIVLGTLCGLIPTLTNLKDESLDQEKQTSEGDQV
ncbi:MAG: O-antigen ligase family protein [Ignavibacteriales bacterium]